MSEHSHEQLARSTIDAYNDGDWDAVRRLTAPEYVYEETGTGRRLEGAEATIVALQEWKVAAPDGMGEVTRVVDEGDTTVMELTWRGTQTGPLITPAGTLPPSGRSYETKASIWLTWKGDELVFERHHLDMLSMLAQIGALPAA